MPKKVSSGQKTEGDRRLFAGRGFPKAVIGERYNKKEVYKIAKPAFIRTSIASYAVTFNSLSFPVLQLVPRPPLQLVPRTSPSLSSTVETGSFILATVCRIGTWSRKTWNKAANLEGTAYLITGSQSDALSNTKIVVRLSQRRRTFSIAGARLVWHHHNWP
jgi:hypothetical protein